MPDNNPANLTYLTVVIFCKGLGLVGWLRLVVCVGIVPFISTGSTDQSLMGILVMIRSATQLPSISISESLTCAESGRLRRKNADEIPMVLLAEISMGPMRLALIFSSLRPMSLQLLT